MDKVSCVLFDELDVFPCDCIVRFKKVAVTNSTCFSSMCLTAFRCGRYHFGLNSMCFSF
jgi:hypothetical protein